MQPSCNLSRRRARALLTFVLMIVLSAVFPRTAQAQEVEEVPLDFEYRVIVWPVPTPPEFSQKYGAAMVVEFSPTSEATQYQLRVFEEIDGELEPGLFRRTIDADDTDDKRRVFDSLCTPARVEDGRCPTFEEFPNVPAGKRWILAISRGNSTSVGDPAAIQADFLDDNGTPRVYQVSGLVPEEQLSLDLSADTKLPGQVIEGEAVDVTVTAKTSREAETMTVACELPPGTKLVEDSITDGGRLKGKTITWEFGRTDEESMEFSFVVGKQKKRTFFVTTKGTASATFADGSEAETDENLALRYLSDYAILDVADANPVAMNGLLLPDADNAEQVPDLDFSRFRFVQGIAADGLSLLLVRAKLRSKKHGEVVLTVEQDAHAGAETGGLFRLDDVSLLDTSADGGRRDSLPSGPRELILDPQENRFKGANKGEEVAFALYRAPRNFDAAGTDARRERTVRFRLEVFDEDDTEVVETTEIEMLVVRPLVILQHGTFNSPTGWDDFPIWTEGGRATTGWGGSSADYPFHVGRSDFSRHLNAAGFLVDSAPYAYRSLLRVLEIWRDQNEYAGTQVDVICHSYGGVNMRWAAQTNPSGDPLTIQSDENFRSIDNWGHGSFHKLITIASTHRGSAVSNQLAYLNRFGALEGAIREAAAIEKSWIDRGAVEDQMVISPRLRQLQRTRVPGHAIAGSGLAHFNPSYQQRLAKLYLADKPTGPFSSQGLPFSSTVPDLVYDPGSLRRLATYGFNLVPDFVRDDTSQDPNFDLTVSSYSSKANMPRSATSDYRDVEAAGGLLPNSLEGALTHGDQISAGSGNVGTMRSTALRVAFLLRQPTNSTFFAEFPGLLETPLTPLETEFSNTETFPASALYLGIPLPSAGKGTNPAKDTKPRITVTPNVATVSPGDVLQVTVDWPDVGVASGYLSLPGNSPGGGQSLPLTAERTSYSVVIPERHPAAFEIGAVVGAPDGEFDTVTRSFELIDEATYTQLRAFPERVRITTPEPGTVLVCGLLPSGEWRKLSDSPRLEVASSDEAVVTIDDEGNFAPQGFGTATITATYDGGPAVSIPVEVSGAMVPAAVSPKRKGKVKSKKKKAIDFVFLSSTTFDPASIDRESVLLEGLSPTKFKTKDVNKDGVKDLIAFVSVRPLGLPRGPASLRLHARTTDGEFVAGIAAATVK